MKTVLWTLTLLAALSSPALAREIIIAADPWCPYNCAPGAQREGFAVEAARLIFARAGLGVDYQVLPWARAQAEARAGRIDAIIGASRAEAPDFIFPDEGLGHSDNAFFVRADMPWTYLGPESLRGLRVALITDYDYGEGFAALTAEPPGSPNVVYTQGNDALERNFTMLACGRVDMVVSDEAVGRNLLSTFAARDAVRFAGTQGEGEPVYLAFSPARPGARELAQIFSEGWRALRASGELGAILARYGLEDPEPAKK
ncbi:transporter substrate-binding domain-containing protein [Desulfocurvus sp.]|uniref:substrate-binding periplasmic protein n=1 Tax=Desulfocurvus sp. TaxID=2871698 RepID=UPI0025BD8745|nr:transporter substrate-binding domain-containing protein [Desulfocurvus sp.]MCK9240450.1 transporter substrate-binding domain-containing protein [Desulfocurvus sp.]